jgi:hypothetical protein
MTEAEWLTCDDVTRMFEVARQMAGWSRRLAVLFGAACVRQTPGAVDQPLVWQAADAVERAADSGGWDEVAGVHHKADRRCSEVDLDSPDHYWALAALRLTDEDVAHWGMHVPFFLLTASSPGSKKGPRRIRLAYASFLRDVAGHTPVQGGRGCQLTSRKGKQTWEPIFRPEWRTDAVTSVAKGIYELRDFAATPILADALQDAGCEQPDLLAHCRDASNPHVRGCWVIDLVLGRA